VPLSPPLDGWQPCTLAAPLSDHGLVLTPTCPEPYGNFDIVGAVGSPEQPWARTGLETDGAQERVGRQVHRARRRPTESGAGAGSSWMWSCVAGEWIRQAALAMRAELPLDVPRDHVAQFALRGGLPGRSGSSRRGAACQRTAHAKEGERNAHVDVALRTSKAARTGGATKDNVLTACIRMSAALVS
jgi:hypothetical protein